MNINKKKSRDIVKLNKSQWEKMDIQDMNPDINLITCQKRLFPNGKNKKLLYIGFGEGQNLPFLVSSGFEVYGTEIAKSRLDSTKKILKRNKQKAVLKLVDSNELPFDDNFFDVVVAWQSICYNNEQSLKEIFDEISRVLKPNGKFLSSMISTKQKLLCGKEIAPNVFHPVKKSQKKCVVFCFKNKGEIKKIYGKKFNDIKTGFYSSELFGSPNFHYVIYCKKGKK